MAKSAICIKAAQNSDNSHSKDQTLWLILSTAIELEAKKGHLKWSFSDLARKAGITRSLIYYYFGCSKEELIGDACRHLADEIFGMTIGSQELWREGKIVQALKATRTHLSRAPWLTQFYLYHRRPDSPFCSIFREVELRYQDKIRSYFPACTSGEVEAIWCFIFGLMVAPTFGDGDRGAAMELMGQMTTLPASFWGPISAPKSFA